MPSESMQQAACRESGAEVCVLRAACCVLNGFRARAAHRDGPLQDLLDLLAIAGREVDVARRSSALDLLRVAGADDRGSDARRRQRPGNRELGDGPATALGVALELAHDRDVAAELLAREEAAVAPPVALVELGVLIDLAGEETMGERAVGERADAVLAAVRKDLLLDLAAEEVVRRLQGVDPPRALEARHLARIEIRNPDVARLALPHELLEDRGGLLERRFGIGPMHLVEVDAVDAELAEALLDAPPQPLRAG